MLYFLKGDKRSTFLFCIYLWDYFQIKLNNITMVENMLENYMIIKDMVKEHIIMLMEQFMKVIGKMGTDKVMAQLNMLVEQNTKAIGIMVK